MHMVIGEGLADVVTFGYKPEDVKEQACRCLGGRCQGTAGA